MSRNLCQTSCCCGFWKFSSSPDAEVAVGDASLVTLQQYLDVIGWSDCPYKERGWSFRAERNGVVDVAWCSANGMGWTNRRECPGPDWKREATRYTTGARISSVVNLRHDKLFRHGKTLVARVPAKKKDEVDIELSATAAAALEDWMMLAPKSDYVFPAPKNHRVAVPRRTFYKRLVKYGKAVGIAKVHPHRFRASYIMSAIDAGVPLHEICAAVHHTDISVTMRYDRGIRGAGVVDAVAAFREKKEK